MKRTYWLKGHKALTINKKADNIRVNTDKLKDAAVGKIGPLRRNSFGATYHEAEWERQFEAVRQAFNVSGINIKEADKALQDYVKGINYEED